MRVIKIKKHKGGNILILFDEWQTFIYIVFYKGNFYSNEITISKPNKKQYTEMEFLKALDGVLVAAKQTIDELKKRSFLYKLFHVKTSNIQEEKPKHEDEKGKESNVPEEG